MRLAKLVDEHPVHTPAPVLVSRDTDVRDSASDGLGGIISDERETTTRYRRAALRFCWDILWAAPPPSGRYDDAGSPHPASFPNAAHAEGPALRVCRPLELDSELGAFDPPLTADQLEVPEELLVGCP